MKYQVTYFEAGQQTGFVEYAKPVTAHDCADVYVLSGPNRTAIVRRKPRGRAAEIVGTVSSNDRMLITRSVDWEQYHRWVRARR